MLLKNQLIFSTTHISDSKAVVSVEVLILLPMERSFFAAREKARLNTSTTMPAVACYALIHNITVWPGMVVKMLACLSELTVCFDPLHGVVYAAEGNCKVEPRTQPSTLSDTSTNIHRQS